MYCLFDIVWRAVQAERESFGRLLLGECGFVDAFRTKHPGVTAYSYWDHKTRARERNSGWRLDYCLARSLHEIVMKSLASAGGLLTGI